MKKPTPETLPSLPLQPSPTTHRSNEARPPSRFPSIAGWTLWWLAALVTVATLPAFAGNTPGDDPAPTEQQTVEAQTEVSTQPLDTGSVEATSPQELSDDEAANTSSGLWIFIDPETGRRVAQPTEEQKARLRKFATALNKSDQGLEPFQLEQGGRGVRLNGRFQHAMIATVQPDGTIGFHCTDQSHDHPDDALQVMGNSAPIETTPAVETTEPAPEQ